MQPKEHKNAFISLTDGGIRQIYIQQSAADGSVLNQLLQFTIATCSRPDIYLNFWLMLL